MSDITKLVKLPVRFRNIITCTGKKYEWGGSGRLNSSFVFNLLKYEHEVGAKLS